MLYRGVFLVRENKVGTALRVLKGVALGKVEIDFISGHPDDDEEATDAKASGPRPLKRKYKKPGEGLPDMVAAKLIAQPPTGPLTTTYLAKLVVQEGGDKTSVYHVTRELTAIGVLKSRKQAGSNALIYTFFPEVYKKHVEKASDKTT